MAIRRLLASLGLVVAIAALLAIFAGGSAPLAIFAVGSAHGSVPCPDCGGGGSSDSGMGLNAACPANLPPTSADPNTANILSYTTPLEAGHSSWARLGVHWNNYEQPTQGSYRASYVSALMSCIAAFHNIGEQVLVVFSGSPRGQQERR